MRWQPHVWRPLRRLHPADVGYLATVAHSSYRLAGRSAPDSVPGVAPAGIDSLDTRSHRDRRRSGDIVVIDNVTGVCGREERVVAVTAASAGRARCVVGAPPNVHPDHKHPVAASHSPSRSLPVRAGLPRKA